MILLTFLGGAISRMLLPGQGDRLDYYIDAFMRMHIRLHWNLSTLPLFSPIWNMLYLYGSARMHWKQFKSTTKIFTLTEYSALSISFRDPSFRYHPQEKNLPHLYKIVHGLFPFPISLRLPSLILQTSVLVPIIVFHYRFPSHTVLLTYFFLCSSYMEYPT